MPLKVYFPHKLSECESFLIKGPLFPLRRFLNRHQVETVFERGWSTLKNGELLGKCEEESFEVFITTDKNLCNQQSLSGRKIAIVVLSSTSWPRIQSAVVAINQAIETTLSGKLQEVHIP